MPALDGAVSHVVLQVALSGGRRIRLHEHDGHNSPVTLPNNVIFASRLQRRFFKGDLAPSNQEETASARMLVGAMLCPIIETRLT